ncbi:hypothetical protein PF007_g19344 [Phytophthora fragariae]|uniref:WRKY19-like zinc finger domain-containing protein n=2 Tax=Phytophthora fragariae TaxID=53985 RepID=A0A6A3I758_9STRA|nr:hypothetical protein PF011_g24188 [Phytophthora fragariae]KAE9090160.1 hypothetical protein PF007_g19344 [Phytophthora fragariae]
MFDPRAVGVDLTPAQQDETLCDLAFFLDNFGSTCAVRTKLQEQESDIKRLDKKVRRLLTCPRDKNLQQEEEREEENNTKNREGEEKEDVDETMADLDFFLRTFGSTRAVREKLETQSQRSVGLHRTVKWLQERWHPDGEGLEDSSDVEYLGTELAPKADKIESKSQVKSDEDERADGTNNARSSEKEADVVPTGRRCCQLPNCEKYAQVNDFCATHGGFRNYARSMVATSSVSLVAKDTAPDMLAK